MTHLRERNFNPTCIIAGAAGRKRNYFDKCVKRYQADFCQKITQQSKYGFELERWSWGKAMSA